jgi:hypothetical protein
MELCAYKFIFLEIFREKKLENFCGTLGFKQMKSFSSSPLTGVAKNENEVCHCAFRRGRERQIHSDFEGGLWKFKESFMCQYQVTIHLKIGAISNDASDF